MALFKSIALLRQTLNEHQNNEEGFTQEEVGRGGVTVARGATTYPPDKKYA